MSPDVFVTYLPGRSLFVVSPKPQDFDGFDARKNLVNEPVLNIDTARVGPGKIANELLKWRRVLERICLENLQKPFRLGP